MAGTLTATSQRSAVGGLITAGRYLAIMIELRTRTISMRTCEDNDARIDLHGFTKVLQTRRTSGVGRGLTTTSVATSALSTLRLKSAPRMHLDGIQVVLHEAQRTCIASVPRCERMKYRCDPRGGECSATPRLCRIGLPQYLTCRLARLARSPLVLSAAAFRNLHGGLPR